MIDQIFSYSCVIFLDELRKNINTSLDFIKSKEIKIEILERNNSENVKINRETFIDSIMSSSFIDKIYEIIFYHKDLMFFSVFFTPSNQFIIQNNKYIITGNFNIKNLELDEVFLTFFDILDPIYVFLFDSDYEENYDLDQLLIDNDVRSGFYLLNKNKFKILENNHLYLAKKLIFYFEMENCVLISDLTIIIGKKMSQYLTENQFSRKENSIKLHKEAFKSVIRLFNI